MTTAQENITGKAAIRGGAATLGGQAVKLVLNLVGLVVLARLLGPSEFGLVAMVTAIVGIGDILRDMGLSSAAIQAKQIDHQQKSNLFWINLGLGGTLSLICAAASGLLADFYGEPKLASITLALSITFLANGFQTQFQAELARQLRFVSLTATDILAMFSGLIIAVVLGVAQAGYWALVAQLVTQSLVLAISRMLITRWIPTWPRRHSGMRPLLRYGRNLMLTQVLVYVSSNIDSVLVGSRFGSASLGLYNRAFQMLTLPLNQIFTPLTNVALPVLSRLQDDEARFRRHVEKGQLVLGYGVVFLFATAFALAEPLIQLVFGAEWTGSVPIFRILAVAGAFQAISYVSYWIFLARALTGSHLRYSLISRSILICFICIGSLGGVYGVAAGYAVGVIFGWFAALIWLRVFHSISVGSLFVNGSRIVCLGAALGLTGFYVWTALAGFELMIGVAAAIVAMSLVVVLCLVIPAFRRDSKVVAGSILRLFRRY